jgi:hypothetical protein
MAGRVLADTANLDATDWRGGGYAAVAPTSRVAHTGLRT